MLSGMTSSSYPQSVALLTDMVSNEPIPVRQELISTAADSAHEAKPDAKPVPKPAVPKPSTFKPLGAKPAGDSKPIGAKPRVEVDKPAA
jgi:hypothetical protein